MLKAIRRGLLAITTLVLAAPGVVDAQGMLEQTVPAFFLSLL